MRIHPSPARQQGLALLLALIALVAMTLAGLAMVRANDSAGGLIGNLAYRMGAVPAADTAFVAAVTWLEDQDSDALESDQSSSGYYASLRSTITDFTDDSLVDWDGSNSSVSNDAFVMNDGEADSNGYTYAYLIHRMCNTTGDALTAACVTGTTTTTTNNSKAIPEYKSGSFDATEYRWYYRITVKVSGPKHAASYFQMTVMR